ncbi:hypothetical protein PTTG_04721 [Puccinia triticina 1-1 BBBD Race 1]|uniref:Usp domain-containing protein n=2 Tax=Puccinia triticina TaxID=208348 RepID=A0A0C4EV89_PUCT1|nr:uncharacterized protein PtA15_1A377 [Puccinia triticina]OAV91209.1 hypothetical protein PTTG_04721 [Puccinia triticina 1-1 BBBD Race 1]WAQ81039.1 hypothetical protein PtA15_1A377 [Puccinia triticina]WAR51930.1 hypothetical protein PtB15_1B367 [Puccinia triticina]
MTSGSLSSSDTHETNLPFPSSSGHEEHHTLPDPSSKPVALRSALKLSSTSAPPGPQNPHMPPSKHSEEPQDGLRSASSPSLPSSAVAPSTSSPLTPGGYPSRPSLSRARSSGELLPPGYERRVGFSTMETEEPTNGGGTGAEYSFTLQAKSSNYKPRRDSRCFLVATDGESYSIQALDWLMSSLVEHGDEVVVLQAVEPGGSAHKDVEKEEHAKTEAQEVLRHVLTKNDRQITVTVEFVIGPAIKTIQRMLEVYRPDSLVVGTRGKNPSAWQKAFSLSSTSQYLVARSPVPVIVVRPERKVRQSREARAKDPKRRSYQTLLGLPSKPVLSPLPTRFESDPDANALRREQTNPV